MGMTREEFNSHDIHRTIADMQLRVRKGYVLLRKSDLEQSKQPEYRQILKQTRSILKAYQENIASIDHTIIDSQYLDQFNRQLLSLADNSIPQGRQADSNLLRRLNQRLLSTSTGDMPADFIANIKAIESSVKYQNKLQEIEAIASRLLGDIKNNEAITSEKVSALENSIHEIGERIKESRDILNATLNDFNKSLSDDRQEFTTQFRDWFSSFQKNEEKAIRTQLTAMSEELQNLQNEAYEKHQAILKFYNFTTGNVVGGEAAEIASKEARRANFWNGFSIFFILCAAIFAVIAFLSATAPEFLIAIIPKLEVIQSADGIWTPILRTVSVIGILVYGATFCASRAKIHHESASYGRWLAVKFQAMNPFIDTLAPEKQAEFKLQVGKKLFEENPNQLNKRKSRHDNEEDLVPIIRRELEKIIKKDNNAEN